MTQNRELVKLVTGILGRNERLSYMELRSSRLQSSEIQMLHWPIVEAIRKRDPAAARAAVVSDIRHGQIDIFGRELVESGQKFWSIDPRAEESPTQEQNAEPSRLPSPPATEMSAGTFS